MNIGDENYLQTLSIAIPESGSDYEHLFSEVFGNTPNKAVSIRQPEFYGSVYAKVKRILATLSINASSTSEAKTAMSYPDVKIPADQMLQTETALLTDTSTWLFSQTLTNKLIGTVTTAIFPYFLYHIFESMKISDSKYEENEFEYLYYLSVIKPLLDKAPVGTTNYEKMKSTISRWWLFYVIHTLRDEAKATAIDFISKLELNSNTAQVNSLTTLDAAKFAIFRLKNKAREQLLSCLNEGTGNAVYEYVRRYIDEVCFVRHAHSEMGRVELKINNDAESAIYSVLITDRSKWLKHRKRVSNSFSHQMYHVNKLGILEPQLDTREISSFITGNYAFSAGPETVKTKTPQNFLDIAIDSRYYIDVSRMQAYINENGMSIPNMVESLAVMYNSSLKDVWFSANITTNMNNPISAIDLQHKMDLLHLSNGAIYKLCGEEYTFDSTVIAELGLKICQRFWSLVIPETSVTGNLQITYDNAFGTPLIEGMGADNGPWCANTLVKGMNIDLYNNITPIVSFLDALKIDGVNIDRSNNLLIGKELLLAFYAVLKSFGIEALKTQMIPWKGSLVTIPSDRDVYPEWTSAIGQSNHTKRFNGFGNLVMQHQCIKSLFNQTNSSQLNSALVKALAIIIAYKTDAITETPIIDEFKD